MTELLVAALAILAALTAGRVAFAAWRRRERAALFARRRHNRRTAA